MGEGRALSGGLWRHLLPMCIESLPAPGGPKPAGDTFFLQDVDTIYHRQGCRHFSLGDFSHLGSRCVACQDWEGRRMP